MRIEAGGLNPPRLSTDGAFSPHPRPAFRSEPSLRHVGPRVGCGGHRRAAASELRVKANDEENEAVATLEGELVYELGGQLAKKKRVSVASEQPTLRAAMILPGSNAREAQTELSFGRLARVLAVKCPTRGCLPSDPRSRRAASRFSGPIGPRPVGRGGPGEEPGGLPLEGVKIWACPWCD